VSEGQPAKDPVYDLLPGETRNYTLVSKTGASAPVEVACFENRSGNELLGAIVTLRDIAPRREWEDRLIQAHGLEAAANLAGAVAHDLNNQLTVILGQAESLEASLPKPDREPAEEIHRAAASAASLARHLITLSRSEPAHPEPLEWNALVSSIRPLLAHTLGKGLAVRVTPGSPAGFVRADRAQMQQMLLLLAGLARKTMPAGGELALETTCLEIERPSSAGHLYPPGEYVRTTVSFSIGATEEGAGRPLELLLVQSIVAQNGGHFRSVADRGRDTYFEILLPSVGTFHGAYSDDGGVRPINVLLTEEEDSVRRMMRDCLLGARLNKGPVGLVIFDALASGNSGTELAERLRQMWPELRTLLITGYRHDAPAAPSSSGSAVLAKPFVGQELLRRVRILLEPAPVTK
jgi:signal transduction histidine kinase